MSFNRREFLQSGIAGIAAIAMSKSTFGSSSFDVQEKSVSQLQAAMRSGEISSTKLTEMYLRRIEEIDPKIRSVVELNPDALDIARKLDIERKNGKIRSPLHGIPILIKDNIDTADRMKTTAGSLALIDAPVPKEDAFVVRQLRNAGTVLLGKTNLSEWANFRSENSSSGWSARGGQTRNPYILDRSPCGSSSGSGAAITSNLAAIAIGTETDGSIVCPASINGIVGLKPTLGLVSRSGIIPIAHSQDTAGPMARTVADAAALLNVIVGYDSNDAGISQTQTNNKRDYTAFLNANALKGARLGILRQYFGRNAELDEFMTECLAKMKTLGATIIDVEYPELKNFGDAEFTVLLYEFKAGINKYLSNRGAKYDSLEKLIEFNRQNAAKEMPYFKQELFEQAQKKGGLDSNEYQLALKKSKALTQANGIDSLVEDNKLDALIAPSNAQSWMIDLINGDSPANYVSSSSTAAVAGYPNITVPAGFLDELPIGISFFGQAFSEPKLLGLAYSWEQFSMARRKPKFLSTFA